MAKSKSQSKSARDLTRILDRTNTPVYALGPDSVILFANPACCDWLQIEIDELIGSKCTFASNSTENLKRQIQGLHPPLGTTDSDSPQPTAHPLESTLFWAFTTDADENKSWRIASRTDLLDADQNYLGQLVVCSEESTASPESDPIACSTSPARLHAALAKVRTQTDCRYSLESLVGCSPFANRLRRQTESAIKSATDLFIYGQLGTGKEHLARTIHASRVNAKNSELLPVHCSIADQQLIHQNIKDIVSSRADSNPAAGTPSEPEQDWLLLLDVDRMGHAAQNELLGFLQLPDFPLRTIATATNSLIELAGQGEFSEQLAHHLSTMTIELVPVAQRMLDLPLLAQALLERDNFRRDVQLTGFDADSMRLLSEFNWPENIDQLNRTIQSAADRAQGRLITKPDLPEDFKNALAAMRIGTASETQIRLDEYLGEIEKQLVLRAIKQAKGNKTKAAKLLGISRPKLLRRIQFFDLDATPDFSEISEPTESLDVSDFQELG